MGPCEMVLPHSEHIHDAARLASLRPEKRDKLPLRTTDRLANAHLSHCDSPLLGAPCLYCCKLPAPSRLQNCPVPSSIRHVIRSFRTILESLSTQADRLGDEPAVGTAGCGHKVMRTGI